VSVTAAAIRDVRVVAYFPIDFPHASRHSAWPDAHLDHLRADAARWRTPAPTDDLALQAYGHDVLDGLLRSMPAAVLEAADGPEMITATASPDDAAALLAPAPGWTLTHARITLWNLGNALAVFTYDLPREAVTDPATLPPATRGHVYALAPAVGRLVHALTAWEDSAPVTLWGNPVYLAKVAPDTDPAGRQAVTAALTTDGLDRPVQGYPDAAIRIGRHCSVAADSFDEPAVDLLLRLAGVHQVCWGAALLYDARLGRELELIRPDDPTLTLGALEQQADRILATYHLVRLFRLRYAAVEAHLDFGAARVWQGLEESWKFPRVLSSLDDRLDFVRTFHQQLFTRLQDSRSRLLNELVLAFTFLNLFSILLGAMTFAALEPLTVRTAAGLAMVLALVVNIGIYVYFRRRSAARR
jgi:hypothetical protein